MNESFISEIEKKLLKERQDLLASLKEKNETLNNISTSSGSGDEADVASYVVDRSLLESLGEMSSNRLKLIDMALERIYDHRYGICVSCHNAIPEARLESLPYTLMCVECASKEERKRR